MTLLPGGSFFHHADSFAMMRGGHLDICVLGAFQVSARGDLANWHTGAEGAIPAVGGAMDLAIGAKRTFVMMEHLTKSGESKLVERCTYPLTGLACVSRVYTDLAVIDVGPHGATRGRHGRGPGVRPAAGRHGDPPGTWVSIDPDSDSTAESGRNAAQPRRKPDMTEDEVRQRAFAMPLHNPAFPPGPYRFVNREYLIISYRTDPDALRALIPAPLQLAEPVVKFEFIRMPDSTGFGDYTESGQVIPVTFNGEHGGFVLSMFLNDHPPIAAGRELWGFPKKLGQPDLRVHTDTLMGTLDYSEFRIATGTMGFKHRPWITPWPRRRSRRRPSCSRSSRTSTARRASASWSVSLTDVTVKGAWTGPGGLDLRHHALAPIADLPVLEILSTVHIVADSACRSAPSPTTIWRANFHFHRRTTCNSRTRSPSSPARPAASARKSRSSTPRKAPRS